MMLAEHHILRFPTSRSDILDDLNNWVVKNVDTDDYDWIWNWSGPIQYRDFSLYLHNEIDLIAFKLRFGI